MSLFKKRHKEKWYLKEKITVLDEKHIKNESHHKDIEDRMKNAYDPFDSVDRYGMGSDICRREDVSLDCDTWDIF